MNDVRHPVWPHNYLFLPEELRDTLSRHGARDIRLSGPGALARSIPNQVLRMMLLDLEYRESFLDLCYEFEVRRPGGEVPASIPGASTIPPRF
jgi:hypothetical protein